MPFSIRMKGLNKFQKTAAVLPARVKKGIADGLKEAAFIVVRESQKALTAGPTRALITGRLRASVKTIQIGKSVAKIAPTVKYAYSVHEGTGRHRRKGPRRYMNVGTKEAKKSIEKIFQKRISIALNV